MAPAQSTHAGTTKWYNVKRGYGFVTADHNNRDYFVHKTNIIAPNPRHAVPSLATNERVQFTIIKGKKGEEAGTVSGPEGTTLKGSKHAWENKKEDKKERFMTTPAWSGRPSGPRSELIQIVVATAWAIAGGNTTTIQECLPALLRANNLPTIRFPSPPKQTTLLDLIPPQVQQQRMHPKPRLDIDKPMSRNEHPAQSPAKTTPPPAETRPSSPEAAPPQKHRQITPEAAKKKLTMTPLLTLYQQEPMAEEAESSTPEKEREPTPIPEEPDSEEEPDYNKYPELLECKPWPLGTPLTETQYLQYFEENIMEELGIFDINDHLTFGKRYSKLVPRKYRRSHTSWCKTRPCHCLLHERDDDTGEQYCHTSTEQDQTMPAARSMRSLLRIRINIIQELTSRLPKGGL